MLLFFFLFFFFAVGFFPVPANCINGARRVAATSHCRDNVRKDVSGELGVQTVIMSSLQASLDSQNALSGIARTQSMPNTKRVSVVQRGRHL